MVKHPLNIISMRSSTFSKRKSKTHPLKFKPAFSNQSTFIWSNLAFISDEEDDNDNVKRSSIGDNIMFGFPKENKRREYFNMNVTEEEMRIRDELAKEIEKELEREIMDGILVLVRRLSDLKAKQIARGLEDLNLDQLLSQVCPSHSCNLCNVDGHVSQWHSRRESPASAETICECLDMESTKGKWN